MAKDIPTQVGDVLFCKRSSRTPSMRWGGYRRTASRILPVEKTSSIRTIGALRCVIALPLHRRGNLPAGCQTRHDLVREDRSLMERLYAFGSIPRKRVS